MPPSPPRPGDDVTTSREDRDALAWVMHEAWGCDGDCRPDPEDETGADAILASSWLAEHGRHVAEQAWDEGYRTGRWVPSAPSAPGPLPRLTNPYQKAETAAGSGGVMTERHATGDDLWTDDGPGPVCQPCGDDHHYDCFDLIHVDGFGLMACDCPDISHIDPEEES